MNEAFKEVPVAELRECPLNPRTRYDEKKIAELADSIKSVGVIEPLVVRPNGPPPGVAVPGGGAGYEIIAGSRRYRAAKLAALADLPVIVRELDDKQALEIMVIENNQREDTKALEEAEGYQRLFARGYSLERLAERIGRSTKYIYDRLKLLQLVPEAKKLLLADRITPGHAILVARLKPDEQKRAIDPENWDIWKHENLFFAPDDRPDEDPVKIVSVRELEAWIDEHVRFNKDVAAVDPMLFPETKEQLIEAFKEREKVIQITLNYYTQPDAKEGNSERIYHISSWKLADGSKGNKSCEKSVTGVIVVGPERGKAYKVCVHKECSIHWGKEKRERERGARMPGTAATDRANKEAEKWRHKREKDEKERAEWDAATPEILQASAAVVKSASYGVLAEIIYGSELAQGGALKDAAELLHKPKSIEDLVRLVCLVALMEETNRYNAWQRFPARVKRLGIDVPAILKAHTRKEEPKAELHTSAKKKKAKV